MTKMHHLSHQFQKGSATLIFSILVLVGATLVVMFSARTSFMEQNISGNEFRTKQAFNAAQAGIDHVLSYLASGNKNLRDTFSATLGDNSTYWAVFWNNVAAPSETNPPTLPTSTNNNFCPNTPGNPGGYIQPLATSKMGIAPFERITVYSCGWSDDRAARKPIIVTVNVVPPSPHNAPAPLITRGAVSTNGRARIFNYFTNLTLWSGGNLDITGNPGNTFVRNPANTSPPIADPLPATPSNCTASATYICTTDMTTIGPDVVDKDSALSSLTRDEFFQAFMGGTKAEIQASSEVVINGSQANQLDGQNGKKIWVNGNASLSGQIGTRDEPVILVVDGDVNVSGNFVFYGVLYITGSMDSNGTPNFYGSTIVEGSSTSAGGTPYYIFDPLALRNLKPLGNKTAVPGTWRDWLQP